MAIGRGVLTPVRLCRELVQYGPAPTHLVWWLLLGVTAVTAVAVLAIPETAVGRPGVLASLRPRMAVPRTSLTVAAMQEQVQHGCSPRLALDIVR